LHSESESRRRILARRIRLTVIATVFSLTALFCVAFLLNRQAEVTRDFNPTSPVLSAWLQQLQAIQNSLTLAENAQRSYVLTGQGHYLDVYQAAVQELPRAFERLDAVQAKDPTKMPQVQDIHRQTDLKLAELSDDLKVYQTSGRDEAIKAIQGHVDHRYLETLRDDISSLVSNRRAERSSILHRVGSGVAQIRILAISTIAALFLAILVAGVQVRLLLRAQRDYEARLAASEQQHRTIVEEQNELIVLSRLDGTISYCNPAYSRFIGPAARQPGAPNLYDSIFEPDRNAMRAALADTRSDDQPVSLETRVQGADATTKWVAWVHSIRPVNGERIVHSVGRDITPAKQTALELQHVRDLLSRIEKVARIGGWELQLQGERRMYWSDQLRAMHNVAADYTPTPENYIKFLPESQRSEFREKLRVALATGKGWDDEVPLYTMDGRQRWVRAIGEAQFDPEGNPLRVIGTLQDISERRELQQKEAASRRELELQTAILNAVIEAIPAMVAVWDTDLRYRLVNRAFERWRGRQREELIGQSLKEIPGDTEYPRSLEWIHRVLSGETVSFEREYPGAIESKYVSITYIPLCLKGGQVDGFVEVAQDITLHREEHVRLMMLSERDPLTGLLNRVGLEKFLSERTDKGSGTSLAMLYIDLDHFKPINDSYGHAAGDEVLKEFAGRLKSIVRPADAVARLGGDEFGIVLVGVENPGVAVRVADKVIEFACRPVSVGELSLSVSASVGIAFDADAQGGWKGLIARADALAYQAKSNGRGRSVVGSTSRSSGSPQLPTASAR
jgi:diguanylate cyclase (GGDEF)-like protein/PAS domain S-box-containing protein